MEPLSIKMKDILIYTCFFSHIFLLVRAGRTVNNSLKCYQCESIGKDPNNICLEKDLQTCPNNVASDRCLTRITRNGTGYYNIVRRCGLAPCDLPDVHSSSLFKLSSNCDRNREEYTCYTCCTEDGCNLNSAIGMRWHYWYIISILTATVVFVVN